jgi:hypothetical protein
MTNRSIKTRKYTKQINQNLFWKQLILVPLLWLAFCDCSCGASPRSA